MPRNRSAIAALQKLEADREALDAAVLGALFDDYIEAWLFNSITVALALVIGGVILLLLEHRKAPVQQRAPV